MSTPRQTVASLAALLALLLAGCPAPSRDNPYDQLRCGTCGPGQYCYDGACVPSPCPAGMVYVHARANGAGPRDGGPITNAASLGPFCVAAYESSRSDGGAARWTAGATPWTTPYGEVAQEACRRAGAELCELDAWTAACEGPLESSDGNAPAASDCASTPGPTGAHPRCEGGQSGLFDLVGNAGEWARGCRGGEGCFIHGYMPVVPGRSLCGDWNADDPRSEPPDVGFRCCVPCSGATCQAKPQFLFHPIYGYGEPRFRGGVAAISGSAPDDVWVLGNWELAHFDGEVLRISKPGFDDLTTVLSVGKKDAWVAGKTQVRHFDGQWSEAKSIDLVRIGALAMDSEGRLWVAGAWGSTGDSVYRATDATNTKWAAVGTPAAQAEVNGLWIDRSGDKDVIWALGYSANKAYLASYDLAAPDPDWVQVPGAANEQTIDLRAMHESGGQRWMVGSRRDDETVVVFHQKSGVWKKEELGGLTTTYARNIVVLDDGQIWVGAQEALHRTKEGVWSKSTGNAGGAVWAPSTAGDELWVGQHRYF